MKVEELMKYELVKEAAEIIGKLCEKMMKSDFETVRKLYEVSKRIEEVLEKEGIEVRGLWWIFVLRYQPKSHIEKILPDKLREELLNKGLDRLFSTEINVDDPRSPIAEYYRNLLS